MSATGSAGRKSSRELDRIVNFTDGVFAIVITLLILTIPAIFLLSIGISFFSVGAAILSWLVMLGVDTVVVRRRLAR